jgi:hypothetical protein
LLLSRFLTSRFALDLSALARSLKGKVFGNVDTNQCFWFPSEAMTTARSLVLYDRQYGSTSSSDNLDDCWERYVRIERTGAIEYCEYDRVARLVTLKQNSEPFRVFLYVQLVGRIWTFLIAAKDVLRSAGYTAGIKYSVNLVGTENSVLADFAHGEGTLQEKQNQRWLQPFEAGEWRIGDSLSKWRCRDENLQFPFKVVLDSLNEPELKKIICECGNQLSLAYNHQSQPRCFPPGSNEFPWGEYEPRPSR